jgi:hypothetical protein
LIEDTLEKTQKMPVMQQPATGNNAPVINEKDLEEKWLKIVMPNMKAYIPYMSARISESGELAWIYKIAQEISGISNSRLASLRNMLLKGMKKEVRNPLADQVESYKQTK